ncbi:Hypothetical predicted protein [Pelobates cultripes]|uniref:Uncharacterized protein n=1 Tax=Pelobates cultripes TaxID=61616 RepID=A0AAD1SFU7_PELCU|nr:Hypothetical predicted protein [Pelobates cultripes]
MADPQLTSLPDSMSPSEEEDQELEEALTYQRRSKVLPPRQTEPRQIEPPLVTKRVKAFFASKMAVLKEDLNALTGRIRATEEDVHNRLIKPDSTVAQVAFILSTCAQLSAKIRQLEGEKGP